MTGHRKLIVLCAAILVTGVGATVTTLAQAPDGNPKPGPNRKALRDRQVGACPTLGPCGEHS
jgi:hypothetical protein